MADNALVPAESRALASQEAEKKQFVTMRLQGQLFGIPVLGVEDVLKGLKVTPIPLAAPEISGALNLRGRTVTVIDMRKRLGLSGSNKPAEKAMQVVVEHEGDLYSLLVDEVGDVMVLSGAKFETNPSNLAPEWARVSKGVYRLDDEIILIIEIGNLLDI